MEEIIIEHNEQYHFQKVHCIEGHYLTTFNDGDDIMNFYASPVLFAPEDIDIKGMYHCITEEQYQEYIHQKEEAEKAIEEQIITEEETTEEE